MTVAPAAAPGVVAKKLLAAKLNMAVARHRDGQLARAKALYREILRTDPRHFDALHLSGVVAAITGNPIEALQWIDRAIEVAPNSALAFNSRGGALQALGRWDAALASYDRAAKLNADYPEPHYNRGNLFKDLRRNDAALVSYQQAIALKADYAEAYCGSGIVLAELRRPQEALANYDQAIAIRPGYADAYYNRGNALCTLRQWEAALASYDRAAELSSGFADAYCNRAFALQELNRPDEALASCNRALAIKPAFARALSNRGCILLALNRAEEALASFDRALSIEPDDPALHVNRGVGRLLAGDYLQGWQDYEWRWRDEAGWIIKEKRDFQQPLWLGHESLSGRAILLQSEQGYGDTLQFCRYAKLVADRGAHVILEVPRALAGILRGLEGVARLVIQGEPLPAFDFYCPLLSLPLALQTNVADVPANVPYLLVSDANRRRWTARLGERIGPRVGLVWSGGFRPDRPELWSTNERRNVPLEKLKVLKHSGIKYYSLQKGEPAQSEFARIMSDGWGGPPIEDFTSELHDFSDTAALIDQLDLVISVDTATAHLAGALGKPVWILNRFDSCWRWMRNRDDSPWYPTARLYRQQRAGDWDDVLRRVAADLAGIL